MCCVSIVRVGSFLARLSWFSEQNVDAIKTEAIRVRTGAVGYARLNIFRRNGRFESDTRNDSLGLNSKALSTPYHYSSSSVIIKNIIYVE